MCSWPVATFALKASAFWLKCQQGFQPISSWYRKTLSCWCNSRLRTLRFTQSSLLWTWVAGNAPKYPAVSSTYLLQNSGTVWKVDSDSCSTSSMTRFATTTNKRDPITVLWICWHTLPQRPGRWPPGKVGAGSRCVHGEIGLVWNWWDVHQPFMDGTGVWYTGERRHYIKRNYDFCVRHILCGDKVSKLLGVPHVGAMKTLAAWRVMMQVFY